MAPKVTEQVTPNVDTPVSASSALTLRDLGLSFDSGTYFLSEDEKDAIIEAGVPFMITGIDFDTQNKFGDRYVLALVPAAKPDAPVRGWSFSCVVPDGASDAARRGIEERAAKLGALMAMQAESGGRYIGPITITQKKRFRTIHDASVEQADDLGF